MIPGSATEPSEAAPGSRSAGLLVDLLTRLRSRSIGDILETGLHEELTETVEHLAVLCDSVQNEYFSGRFRNGAAAREMAKQG